VRPSRSISLVLAAIALAVAAGCGGTDGGQEGQAMVVISPGSGEVRSEGVAAGQTALRALRSLADVETRYGGRFVVSIDGLAGDTTSQLDWLYYVNGYLADRSAAEYRLHSGDVVQWLYRSWREPEQPVLTSGFPTLFLRGYGGQRRPAAVRYDGGLALAAVRRAASVVGAGSVAPIGTPVARNANVLELIPGPGRMTAALRRSGGGPGSPALFRFAGDPVVLTRQTVAVAAP
jgi:uncharacterized protein DUF4430